MKTSTIRRSALAVAITIVAMAALAPQTGFAGWPPPGNDQLGMYHWNEDMQEYVPYVNVGIALPVTLDIYLTGISAPSIGGYEFLMSWDPAALLFMVDLELPPDALNIEIFPEFLVGFGSPPPIIDGNVQLCRLTFIHFGEGPAYVFVGPGTIPSIPGAMAYIDFELTELYEMFPMSGDYDLPIFAFNEVVAIESQTWSELKSMYR